MMGVDPAYAWPVMDLIAFTILPGTIMALAAAAVRRGTRDSVSPRAWKAIWLLLAIRLLIPFGISMPLDTAADRTVAMAWNAYRPLGGSMESKIGYLEVDGGSGRTLPIDSGGPDALGIVLIAAYLVGVSLSISVLGSRLLSSRYLATRAEKAEEERLLTLFGRCCATLGFSRPPRLYASDLCPGPASWGIHRPSVLVPPLLSRELADDELRRVFLHELSHLKDRDPLWTLLLDLACSLFWFLPGIWIVRKGFIISMEEAADRRALDGGREESGREYGATLIRIMEWQKTRTFLPGAKAMAGSKDVLRRRIRMILSAGTAGAKPLRAAAVLVIVAVIALAQPSPSFLRSYPPAGFDYGRFSELSQAYGRRMDWAKASRLYGAMIAADPEDAVAAYKMAKIYMGRGRWKEALAILGNLPSLDAWSLAASAICRDCAGDREGALRMYRALKYIQPQESLMRVALTGLSRPMGVLKAEPRRIEGVNETPLSDTSAWSLTGGVAAQGKHPLEAAIDGDLDTRWASAVRQAPGMEIMLDLGKAQPITRLWLVDDAGGNTISTNDYPRGYRIDISLDGKAWETAGTGEGFPDEYAGASFPPRRSRFIRFTQTGTADLDCWSVYEIRVMGVEE